MDENQECVEGEENIYEEINSLSLSEIEEPISLLHGISAGRREMIRNYALADWDFEQQFQDSNFEENTTMVIGYLTSFVIFILLFFRNASKGVEVSKLKYKTILMIP